MWIPWCDLADLRYTQWNVLKTVPEWLTVSLFKNLQLLLFLNYNMKYKWNLSESIIYNRIREGTAAPRCLDWSHQQSWLLTGTVQRHRPARGSHLERKPWTGHCLGGSPWSKPVLKEPGISLAFKVRGTLNFDFGLTIRIFILNMYIDLLSSYSAKNSTYSR